MARLKIIDDNCFYVYTFSIIEHRFIDNCKNDASEFLQKELNNYLLQIYIIREENTQQDAQSNASTTLTAVQQYQKMIEKYPLVKELKEKMKMELDR